MKKLSFKVKGMTCSSCEILIERKLAKVPGVRNVSVNQAREEVNLDCEDDVQVNQLQEAVKEKYTLVQNSAENPQIAFFTYNKGQLTEIGSVLVILLGAYVLLRELQLLPQGFGVTDNMSYGFVFLIGLVAATSSCLAVAGGLLLTVAGKFNEKYPNLSGWQKFRPHVYFNLGRIFSYTLLGGVIGLLGSALTISPAVIGAITIISSVLMIIAGLQLLHLFPWLNKIQLKMPKFIVHRVYGHQERKSTNSASSFLFGAATFFLPCGFTQALQLYVLSLGSFVVGALTMLAFSLGTLPSLVGIGAFSSFAKGSTQRYFMTFSALLIIFLGIFNISSGFALTGTTIFSPEIKDDSLPSLDFNIVNDKQIVNMEVRGLDYYPATFTLKKGVPVDWNIDARKAQGCAQIITVPQLGITERLPQNKVKTITFTPEKSGTIKFTCGMGMAGPGKFVVVE